jgi:hypothetical protein
MASPSNTRGCEVTSAAAIALWDPETGRRDDWTSNASGGSTASLSVEQTAAGSVLRFDYSLAGEGSWVIARRELTADLPHHFAAVMRLRGEAPANDLQLKLVDPSGANVWWWRRRDFAFPPTIERVVLRRANLEFAWGPLSGGDPERIGAVEIAVAGSAPGSGVLWIESARIEPRRVTKDLTIRAVHASSRSAEHEPANVLNSDDRCVWQPDLADPSPWLVCDLGDSSEWGGAVVDLAGPCPGVKLLASDDGKTWTQLANAPDSSVHGVWLRTPDGEGRYARLEFAPGSTPTVTRARIVPLELAVAPSRYMTELARKAPRGRYPRHVLGEQAYWAAISADGDEHKGLLGEDGAVEVEVEGFSIEPFLQIDGRTLSWADVESSQSLAEGCLPIPSVEWRTAEIRLTITAFASGPAGASTLVARYEIENLRDRDLQARLFLAIRPFQVNPAWQSLNLVGGTAPIFAIRRQADVIRVNDSHDVIPLSRPDAFTARSFEETAHELGDSTDARDHVEDPIGFADGVLAFDLAIAPRSHTARAVAVPYAADSEPATSGSHGDRSLPGFKWADKRLAATLAYWRERLDVIPIKLPPCARAFEESLRASIAWILVNRAGVRIQPGTRCYRRSWIRDGTLTGTALAEMGFAGELKDFLRWYAPFQLADGQVPCAVDLDGVDRVPEHDSHGQLVWGVVETYRLTGDVKFLRELWPHVLKAVSAIETLRALRTVDEYRDTPYFGLLPESISHEGYSSRPVHSYWDDFFALRGLSDAADAAAVMGDAAAVSRILALRDAMRHDVHASIERAIRQHGIDFVPGSADLGDFDPTSSAIAFDPCDEADRLPVAALARTFDRYWEEFEARRLGDNPAAAYTAYEVRTASALLMLGHKDRAYELLDWLIADQRLAAWREWPEISWRDRRAPRFVGDIPHGWIASSFVRAVRRMVAYERTRDRTLVLAAGIPEAWVREAPGVRVHALPTHHGLLDFSLCGEGDDRTIVKVGGSIRVPEGGIVIESPGSRPIRTVIIDGARSAPADPHRLILRKATAEIVLEY